MFMPGISLWRVLLQLAGMSLLVSYCVTLTLRTFHSTRCRAAFNCDPETDPKLASLREWQVQKKKNGMKVQQYACKTAKRLYHLERVERVVYL